MSGLTNFTRGETTPVTVTVTAPGTGLSAAQIAELCANKIVHVGPDVPPAIREQAHAFREQVHITVLYYTEQAQRSQRTTDIGALERAGLHEAAALLRSI